MHGFEKQEFMSIPISSPLYIILTGWKILPGVGKKAPIYDPAPLSYQLTPWGPF